MRNITHFPLQSIRTKGAGIKKSGRIWGTDTPKDYSKLVMLCNMSELRTLPESCTITPPESSALQVLPFPAPILDLLIFVKGFL